MSIQPLPVFEADADAHHRDAMTDAEQYAALEIPKTLVVRFGAMKLIAELPYDGSVRPGCGTKLVARTHRGTEIVEMLTTTCDNAGCAKSVTRQEMLEYIENSGGADFPFHTQGRVLRVATIDDLNRFADLESRKREWVKTVKAAVRERQLDMKVVEVEPILGEEVLTVYFIAEERVDFRELVRSLASQFHTRIEMRQVGARDEARLVADYERCGQHCCCKNFLKVLKPVSMRSAKVQKATLDPLKISGRCGRLMCCLRYEDQTYKQLKTNLPYRKTRVGTSEGPGLVLETKILAQLVLVRLEDDGREIAVPVEELLDPEQCPKPGAQREAEIAAEDPLRGLSETEVKERTDDTRRQRRGRRGRTGQQDRYRKESQSAEPDQPRKADSSSAEKTGSDAPGATSDDGSKKKTRRGGSSKGRRRRGRRGRRGKPGGGDGKGPNPGKE